MSLSLGSLHIACPSPIHSCSGCLSRACPVHPAPWATGRGQKPGESWVLEGLHFLIFALGSHEVRGHSSTSCLALRGPPGRLQLPPEWLGRIALHASFPGPPLPLKTIAAVIFPESCLSPPGIFPPTPGVPSASSLDSSFTESKSAVLFSSPISCSSAPSAQRADFSLSSHPAP